MNRFVATLFLSLSIAVPAIVAHATSQQANTVIARWKQSDKCAQRAQTDFPDFTREANAKRDAALKACLDGQSLPPREPLTPGH